MTERKSILTAIRTGALLFGALVILASSVMAGTVPVTAYKASASLTVASSSCPASPGSTASCVTIPVSAINSGVAWQVAGTFVGTVTFEGSLDGANWVSVQAIPVGLSRTGLTTVTAPGQFQMNVAGLVYARARCSAYTSGPIVVTGARSGGPPPAK